MHLCVLPVCVAVYEVGAQPQEAHQEQRARNAIHRLQRKTDGGDSKQHTGARWSS